jgi:hypothetical protein
VECSVALHRAEECQLTVASFSSNADPDGRAVALPRDTAGHRHALLVSRRDCGLAYLDRIALAQDPAVIDEHSEISATVAAETLHDIENALARFDGGTYGSCDVCGGAIALEWLEATRHATMCVTGAVTWSSWAAGRIVRVAALAVRLGRGIVTVEPRSGLTPAQLTLLGYPAGQRGVVVSYCALAARVRAAYGPTVDVQLDGSLRALQVAVAAASGIDHALERLDSMGWRVGVDDA